MPLPCLLYAHRGASALLPENTLPAFARGLADGANALELDVHLTRDGEVVVSHDLAGRRMAGRSELIEASTLAEVRGWDVGLGFLAPDGTRPFVAQGFTIPTFAEVLAAFPVPLNVDLKPRNSRLVRAAMELVAKHGATDRVRLASFHDANLDEVRRLGYAGPLGMTPRDLRWLVLSPAWMSRRWPPKGTAVQIPPRTGPFRLATRALVAHAHALGLRVDYWVINDLAQARALLALGADGLMTDDPARLRELFPSDRSERTPDPSL
jgi:glycerophosphoryl diester phosphodiesterase